LEVLYENEYVQINIDRENKFLEYHLKKIESSEQYKNSMEKVYELVCKNDCNKLLPVLKNNTPIPKDARIWAISVWFPRLVKKGVSTFAVVNPYSGYASTPLDKLNSIYERRQTGIAIVYFNDLNKARTWISSL